MNVSHMLVEGVRVAVVLEGAAEHGAKLLRLGVDWLVPLIVRSISEVVEMSLLENNQEGDSPWAGHSGVEAGRALVALLAA